MNHTQAVQAANEGHIVRRTSWEESVTLQPKEGRLYKGNKLYEAQQEDVNATDWELTVKNDPVTEKIIAAEISHKEDQANLEDDKADKAEDSNTEDNKTADETDKKNSAKTSVASKKDADKKPADNKKVAAKPSNSAKPKRK
ncbi:MAG: hypothetical protein H7321_09275 [Bacteroidia bacterium]|nr:hypothetical protein [Bacteroidia bacterium]